MAFSMFQPYRNRAIHAVVVACAAVSAFLYMTALPSVVMAQSAKARLSVPDFPITPTPVVSTAAESSESDGVNHGNSNTAIQSNDFGPPFRVVDGLSRLTDETTENRYQSAPFDRSGSVLFLDSQRLDGNGARDGANRPYPTLNWSGFLQVDTGWIYQDAENIAAVGRVNPSTGLRRVRLRVDGNIQEATSYVLDLDFAASGHPGFRNVGLTFHDVPTFQHLELGLLKTPFGLDALTSGRELLFMERQLPFALVPFRQVMIGVRGSSLDKSTSWGASVYRMPTDSFGVYEGGDGGIAIAGRLTRAPIFEDNGAKVLHFGGGYSVGSPGDGHVQYRIQPGFFTRDPGTDGDDPGTVPVFLDTGKISTSLFNLFNLEFGMNAGPFHLAAEMRWALLDQRSGPALTFPGFYVQASYVLTGESHRYSRERGVFQRVNPSRPFERGKGTGIGAWEATVGYSSLDLNDRNITGGSGETMAMGVNWYLTRNMKLQFNVLPGWLAKPGFSTSRTTVTAIRAQVEF